LIQAKWLYIIKKELNLKDEELEMSITYIKHGGNGREGSVRLPIQVTNSRVNSIEGVLHDIKVEREIEKMIVEDLPQGLKKRGDHILLQPTIEDDYIETLRLRGLKPRMNVTKKFYLVQYRIPIMKKRKEAVIPRNIIFNEVFSKQFGKWMGDRCGGSGKVGVSNTDLIFVNEFGTFLRNVLNQKDVDFYGTCRYGEKLPKSIMLTVEKVRYCKTQKGKFAYRTEVSNALLKRKIFDVCERHLFQILYNSKPSVRYAFYAGLFEAEGSLEKRAKRFSFAFGKGLNDHTVHADLLDVYKKAIELNVLLKKDGFHSRISRKCTYTKRSQTIKYDVDLTVSQKTRAEEVRFIKDTFFTYITHPIKIETMREVFP